MKLKTILSLVSLATVFAVVDGCVDHNLPGPFVVACTDAKAYQYQTDIVPIINANCAFDGCHNGSEGDLPDWTEYAQISDAAHRAEIVRRIKLPLSDPDKMPRVGSITQEERQALVCWIEQGALNN